LLPQASEKTPHDFHYYIAPFHFAEKGLQKTFMVVDRAICANIALKILEDPLMTWKSKMPSPVRDSFFREYATTCEDRPVAVDCALGTNPLGAPEVVLKHLGHNSKESSVGISSYPSSDDLFRKALSKAWNNAFEPDEILFGTGSIGLIISVARTFCGPGTIVLGIRPQFPDGPLHFRLAGAEYASLHLGSPDFSIDLDALASKLTGEESLVYIDNPHNPTGQAIPTEAVKSLADACAQNGALLVVDEAYGDYLPPGESSLLLNRANIITLRSFAKGWGLAGIRAGYAVVRDPEVRRFLAKVAPPFSVNTLAGELAMAALEEKSFLVEVRKVVSRIKKEILKLVGETPCIKASKTHPAVPILLLTHTTPSADLYELLMTQGIRTEPGTCFEGLDSSSVRLRIPAPGDLRLFKELWHKALQ
jgi:histidinol-phosphate aminotransferase